MRTNKLKLNDDKTEGVLFHTKQQLGKVINSTDLCITIGYEVIKPAQSTRNLGFFMDSDLKSKTMCV